MKKLAMIILVALTAVPVQAYDLAPGIGFSDVSVFTKSERRPVMHLGWEATVVRGFRVGGSFTKEGFHKSEGWGLEFHAGRRNPLPLGLRGITRIGVIWMMPASSSGRLDHDVGPDGELVQWRWRTIRQRNTFGVSATVMPFVAYGVRRPLGKTFFIESQVRVAIAPTLDARYRADGMIRTGRGTTFIPGYRISLGWSF
jgi:hypothetical protein